MIDKFMDWWESTPVYVGFAVLLILALPLAIIEFIVDRQERPEL